ncbi:glycoside hydrolase family 95 protein [Olivibacter domesticus]|uniref:Alpha-L-fucosidase 2 n=1 Tax=Olivibacter domesticus TaxID=407022 RepID=A0A1H7K7Z3_OLID1|nr:glycoside hydrolase family 95 protein [Olivibacter domesticus]SEK82939.1 alpha-L-fucosidase 2 [Olivibacter domesticus]
MLNGKVALLTGGSEGILFKAKFFIALIFVVISSIQSTYAQQYQNKLWYTSPADATAKDNPDGWVSDQEWLKALPIGNGRMGAMVFGDVNQERVQLNELSLWSGSVDDNDNPEARKYLPQIRKLLFEGKYKEASELTNKTQVCKGKGSGQGNGANVPFGCYQTLGDLWLDFGTKGKAYTDYSRELDLINGIAKSSFTQNGVTYIREVFSSFPDQAIVIRLTANKPKSISFSIDINRPERFKTISTNKQLVMSGILDNGKGGDGMHYKTFVTPLLTDGTLSTKNNQLQVSQATAVTILITAKTNYRLHYPDYINNNFEKELDAITKKAGSKTYIALKQAHMKDFSAYMNRVDLKLDNANNILPTNELMGKNFELKNENAYYPLYLQFGRYLLLSSSRDGGLPANLQGIWANKIQTPWNGDYHTDINVQMNYWPAETTNLAECHKPLMDLIFSIQEPAKKTAKTQYGMKGWALHPVTNVWGYTAPGEHPSWGMHVGAGAWIAQHLWEHYAFNNDKSFLTKAYPALKGACMFYLDWLVKDPKTGKLVSGPSPSPENTFKAPDGATVQISMGPTHDQEVIYDLFEHTLATTKILGISDAAFVKNLTDAKNKLARPKIGSDGRLMEWAKEFEEVEPTHRHLSHLFALYPGNEISPNKTPELAEAVKKSLEARGDGGVGWTFAWKIALWARLHDGNRALSILNSQLRPTTEVNTLYNKGGGAYYNLFNAGPPFQIDGNLGIIAGMAEMFVQSHEEFIELLPALPNKWKEGSIKGLVARGGFVVNIEWENGKLTAGSITSKKGGKCKVKYGDKIISLSILPDQTLTITEKL